MESYVKGSSGGINVPQMLIAGLEDLALTGGDYTSAGIMAASVGISSLIPQYSDYYSSAYEKYIIESAANAILYSLGSYMMGSKEKMIKKAARGFVIGSSSAAVAGALVSSALVKTIPAAGDKPAITTRAASIYSANTGLRSDSVSVNYPSFTVV